LIEKIEVKAAKLLLGTVAKFLAKDFFNLKAKGGEHHMKAQPAWNSHDCL
jgi:hypothetical protein